MFEARLKIVLGVFAAALLAIVVRLVDLQIVRADEFRRQAEQALLRPARMLPFVRGRILDRLGTELAADQPCWEIAVDYGVVAGVVEPDPGYLRSRARHLLRTSADTHLTLPQAEQEVRRRIERLWLDLAYLSGESVDHVRQRAGEVRERIARVRALVSRRRGFDTPVAEERMRHPIVGGLNDQEQVVARQLLADYPWVEVRSSTYRWYDVSASLPHLLGQQGAVTAEAVADDPDAGDPLSEYIGSERLGVSGVEYAAERRLRGRRGLVRENRKGATVGTIAAENGRDVTLTIRVDLQEALHSLLVQMLPGTPHPTGGAIVVLDVPTREVLALVSYPGYDNNVFRKDYHRLAQDLRRQPLRFRAVANHYAPGSIVKPLTCAAGLSLGGIMLGTSFDCQGYYYPETRSGKKCWPIHGTNRRKAHGPLTVTAAIAHSCNIFMYHTGERVGVTGLCNFFDMAGVGRLSGTGLREEVRGINPTPSYLASRGRSVAKGDAWNFAIGQGEVSLTPVQAANLMAVFASGVYRPVTLMREGSVSGEWKLPVKPEHWRAIRKGLFRVTNEPGATAFKTANFVRDGYALCGKTGSATVYPWPISYAVPYTTPDGDELIATVPANSRREALERFEAEYREMGVDREGIEATAYWPPLPQGRHRPSRADQQEHAWFVGYLQSVSDTGQPQHAVTPRIAFSVLVEFGGSGGRVAGPIAKRVAETIMNVLDPGLDPDTPAAGSAP